MKRRELLKLVWTNLMQNKFKVILTSIGIVVGAATIVMVIAIGRGGQMEVAEQFKNLNAGAIDISYELSDRVAGEGNSNRQDGGGMPGGMPNGNMPQMQGKQDSTGTNKKNGNTSAGKQNGGGQGMPSFGDMPEGGNFIMGQGNADADSRINQEKITLSEEDVEELEVFLPEVSSVSISYTTKTTVDGGDLEEAATYSIAGVKSIYTEISNLKMKVGEFITTSNEENKDKICVLGASVAKEIFGSAIEAYDSIIYIDSRPYVVNGIIEEMGTVSSGISPDEAIFIPYSTGIKYIAGTEANPTITVIAEDLNNIAAVISNIETVLAETYPNAEFTISDAGSKMEAASASNDTLTMLLFSMATIVFVIGGIGIMNVLFVSVKERTKEIGILKAIGCPKRDILLEFLFEACFISMLGGILGVFVSFGITPIIEMLKIRVELSVQGILLSIGFALITGTIFGFYPAWKASNLVPVEALNEE